MNLLTKNALFQCAPFDMHIQSNYIESLILDAPHLVIFAAGDVSSLPHDPWKPTAHAQDVCDNHLNNLNTLHVKFSNSFLTSKSKPRRQLHRQAAKASTSRQKTPPKHDAMQNHRDESGPYKVLCCKRCRDLSSSDLEEAEPLPVATRELTLLLAQIGRCLELVDTDSLRATSFKYGAVRSVRRNKETGEAFTVWFVCKLRREKFRKAPFVCMTEETMEAVVRHGILVDSGIQRLCGGCTKHTNSEFTLTWFDKRD